MSLNFYMPVKLITGENCIENNRAMFAIGKRCFIVTGKHSAITSGALGDVAAALTACGAEYIVFDKISENPLLSVCAEGGHAAALYGADFVVGIGGGSPLDAAKAIAAFAANDGIKPSELFEVNKLKPSLPLIGVPTTAGTGSEVNPYSIVTLDGEGKKKTFNSPKSYFKYAFVDPKYTYSLGKEYTVSTALDAFCHCIESYLSPKSSDASRLFAGYGAKKIWEVLTSTTDTYTSAQRESLSYAATAGGIAINATGTGFPHPLGYNLTLDKGVPHGRACAVFTGLYIEYNQRDPEGKRLLDMFAESVGVPIAEIAEVIPKLANVSLKLDNETITDYINKVKTATNFVNAPYKLTESEMQEVYTRLFA
jgi:Alcohol dehydrogenase, class IV